ncbi:hypothetical protein [Sneathiella sp.]|uniref:hypothetical protein n=1 Tax=Sneathiella sp. TaxID=1964365 RepID=UPI0035684455
MLSDEQIRAAEKISRGFQLRTAGLSARTQSFNWQPKSAFVESGRDYALMQQFMSWAVAVQEAGLSVAVILDILVFGKSCRTVDKERNRRHGFARAYLLESLQIYENLFTKNPVR